MQIYPLVQIIISKSSWGEGAGDWNVEDREDIGRKKKLTYHLTLIRVELGLEST